MGDGVGLGGGDGQTVGTHDGTVVGLVRTAEFNRHSHLVVKSGERVIRIKGTSVQKIIILCGFWFSGRYGVPTV